MVLLPGRCSDDTGEVKVAGEDTGAQSGQEGGLHTTYLVRSPVGVSLLSPTLPASLLALGFQHHPQPTTHTFDSRTAFFPP